ncbi:MAG TPA: ATP-dependent zinc metalloprotease FtsH [Planctomycetaceae bacterium]|nr:ATP-dependent zinc metalloprotease FtsH [Planctomycetaceae bacterium]
MADNDDSSSRPSKTPRRVVRGGGDDAPKSSWSGSGALFFLVMLMLLLWAWRSSPTSHGSKVTYTFLKAQAEARNVDWAMYRGDYVVGEFKSAPTTTSGKQLVKKFNSALPPEDQGALRTFLEDRKVEVSSEPVNEFGNYLAGMVIVTAISLLLLWFLIRRQSDPLSSGMAGSFIRSPARRFRPSDHQTTFDDVAAMEQAKRELQEIVEFLKTPAKFQRLGAQIPKGVLLMGPPGTGKTLLVRAVAGEAGVPFFSINGSEFIQMFVGVGASRVRDLFRTAKENSPCLIFIDEIDAVGRIRGAGFGGGHDEREQTLNQILSEMDGFQQTEAVIVVASTNRPDVLDPALLRPGRFDRHVAVDRPTRSGREGILKVHVRNVPLDADVDLKSIANSTIGFSGAELKNLVNEAALHAARFNRNTVTMDDFDAARDKVLMGPQREEILSPHEREMTAYHEAGHALLAWMQPDVDPLHKVTIIPRGRALGVTQLLPNEDRYNVGERRLHSQLAFMLGGRAAEKLIFNEYSAGAEDDLKRATGIARKMVSRWGMSDVIGPVAFHNSDESPFLGKEYHEQRDFSDETARTIDSEVQRFLVQADHRAMQTLKDHRGKLDALTQALLKEESLDYPEIVAVLGEPAPRSDAVPQPTPEQP